MAKLYQLQLSAQTAFNRTIFGVSIIRTEYDDTFTLSGNLDDIYDQLLHIQSLANNMGIDHSLLTDLSKTVAETKSILDGYEEIYNQHILYDNRINCSEIVSCWVLAQLVVNSNQSKWKCT